MSAPLSPPINQADLAAIAAAFALEAEFVTGAPHGNGLINDTFVIQCRQRGAPLRFIFQRINHHVFRNVPALMENVQRVTTHLAHHQAAAGRQTLRLIPTPTGQPYHLDAQNHHWRCYNFIEGAQTYDVIETLPQARAAAYAFGEFQAQLADFAGPRLHETIPHFHHTRQRFANLQAAIATNAAGRVASVGPEIDFVVAQQSLAESLLRLHESGQIPERITHNDTKISNVMLDSHTGEAVCVIDLDTIMPGLALYDIGDLIRSATNPCLEDETDLDRIHVQLPVFEQLIAGYLEAAHTILNPTEIAHLVLAGQLLAYEMGIRFLTDYLDGDNYYKIKHARHNLDRARGQFALLRSMQAAEPEMQQIVTQQLQALVR
jgi:aminoglycoside phosphotransferase (APT) family kinase protein